MFLKAVYFTVIIYLIAASPFTFDSINLSKIKSERKVQKRVENLELFATKSQLNRTNSSSSPTIEPPKFNAGDISESLEWFVTQLLTFVQGNQFDSIGYSLREEKLHSLLERLGDVVNKMYPFSPSVARQLRYARYLFRLMYSSNRILNFYSLDSRKASAMVNRIVRFNLQLLSLFTVYGTVNKEKKDIDLTISNLYKKVAKMDAFAQKFSEVLSGTQIAFINQLDHAKKTLNIVQACVSEEPMAICDSWE